MATDADPLAALRPVRLPADAPAALVDLVAAAAAAGILVALAVLVVPRLVAAVRARRSPRRRAADAVRAAAGLPPAERLAAEATALRAYVAAVAGAEAARDQGEAWLGRLDAALATTVFTAGAGRLYATGLYAPVDVAALAAAEDELARLLAVRREARPC